MNKEKFDSLFSSQLIGRLTEQGFSETKTHVYRNSDGVMVSLLRLGGRMNIPGTIAHILCFRHDFLPNLNEKIPKGLEKEVFSYPFKLKPSEVIKLLNSNEKYKSQNLSYDYERFDFRKSGEDEASAYLSEVSTYVIAFFEWAKNLSLNETKLLIIKGSKELAWIEKIWIQAYKNKEKQRW